MEWNRVMQNRVEWNRVRWSEIESCRNRVERNSQVKRNGMD